ncbi:hypothetical protein M23134_04224 [Microscilla marina ATCC 23134]|uniref:Effector-associated domain-containing protein n=2 Tax=Microscilla marina TaxID=1027 RepID=A1ZE83_MICM2|nr:hypothetical protein M23134_04224 [Microscilla marina ATCC 23134]
MMKDMKEPLERIKRLVGQGRLDTAIGALKELLLAHDMLNEAILQSGRLTLLQKQLREGTIDWNDASITHVNIMEAILGLVDIMEEEDLKLPEEAKNKNHEAGKTENNIQVTGDSNMVFGSVKGNVNNHK